MPMTEPFVGQPPTGLLSGNGFSLYWVGMPGLSVTPFTIALLRLATAGGYTARARLLVNVIASFLPIIAYKNG